MWLDWTFDGIGFGQLRTIFKKGLRDSGPGLSRLHAEVYMCTGEIVGMKLEPVYCLLLTLSNHWITL